MEVVVLERKQSKPHEATSRIKAGNIVLNVTSLFDGQVPLEDLLFRVADQNIGRKIREETAARNIEPPPGHMV